MAHNNHNSLFLLPCLCGCYGYGHELPAPSLHLSMDCIPLGLYKKNPFVVFYPCKEYVFQFFISFSNTHKQPTTHNPQPTTH